MRVSCSDKDPGYENYWRHRVNGKTPKVFLDGKEVKQCVTADEEEGYVLRNLLNDDGEAYLVAHTKEVARAEERGKVEIVWEDRHGTPGTDSD